MGLSIGSTARLANGVEMPRLGLGVWQAKRGGETKGAVRAALEVGYRHIDTARIYNNEEDVGAAIRESGLARSDVFVTTKLWNDDQGYDSALRACDASLARLGLDHIDLYLIHWPVANKRLDSWRALEKLLEDGKCRAIGVSNYYVRHLDEVLAHAKVVPMVNQVEQHPFLYLPKLNAKCREHGIIVEAYSPLTKGMRIDHPALVGIAREHERSPAQILIRWCLQHDLVVLPKSVRPERIRENASVFDFEISESDMKRLDALDEQLHTAWDPSTAP